MRNGRHATMQACPDRVTPSIINIYTTGGLSLPESGARDCEFLSELLLRTAFVFALQLKTLDVDPDHGPTHK
jgi:hypothetical protein